MAALIPLLLLSSCGTGLRLDLPDLPGLISDDADGDGFEADAECDDDNAAISPDATENCSDGLDNDCDGDDDCDDADCAADLACAPVCADADSDGEGDDGCGGDDCDDGDPDVYAAAAEDCTDNKDNDCDGDEDCDDADCAADAACVATEVVCTDEGDDDSDGFYDCADSDCLSNPACEAVEATCNDNFDNDADSLKDCMDPDCAADIHCVAAEFCTNGADEDLDSYIDCADPDCASDPACEFPESSCGDGFDNDGDSDMDCNDSDCAADVLCCADFDGDGYHDGACSADGDCDDTDPDINPGVDEANITLCGNTVDESCDGIDFDCQDLDQDGDTIVARDDCDDGDALNFPGNTENCTDSNDNNCDTLIDCSDPTCTTDPACCADLDGDGYGDESCGGEDCDDGNVAVNPGATDYSGAYGSNGIDDDCDGTQDNGPPDPCEEDGDSDGFNTCGADITMVDCDDSSATINPNATEDCGDSIDNNCDGSNDCADASCSTDIICVCLQDSDADDDGADSIDCGGDDCDDADPSKYPAQTENCSDAIDNDCDGDIDCDDSGCAADVMCDSNDWDGDSVLDAADDCADFNTNGHAYSLCGLLTQVDFSTAVTNCNSIGGPGEYLLASLSTSTEFAAVIGAIASAPIVADHFYLDGTDMDVEGVFRTSHGIRLSYTPWQSGGFPGSGGGGPTQNCLVGVTDAEMIFDIECTETLYYLCEKNLDGDHDSDGVTDASDNCPFDAPNPDQADTDNDDIGEACEENPYGSTTAFIKGSHIWAYFDNNNQDFAGARGVCNSLGGHLVTIADAEENSYVMALQPADWTYLGLTDIDQEGAFQWVTGEIQAYRNWGEAQPDNAIGHMTPNQDAVVMNWPSGEWDDMWHDQSLPFVCEFADGQTDNLSVGSNPDNEEGCMGEDYCI